MKERLFIIQKAYKLLRIKKDGKIYPLFINKSKPTDMNVWLKAECIPTKGFAVRTGFHCCFQPIAPHLKTELANGQKRVWVECDVFSFQTYKRPLRQGGTWILANNMKINKILNDAEVYELQRKGL